MIPSDLFHDLVDAQVAFKVVQRNPNRGDYVFNVSRAAKSQLRLSMQGDALTSTAGRILARLNALLCQDPGFYPQSLSLKYPPSLDDGKCIDLTIIPEESKAKRQGFPEAIPVSFEILVGDRPNVAPQTALVRTVIGKKHRLYFMELVDKDAMLEICRLSPHALPQEIHAKLAAAGFYDDSFIRAYGEEAYLDAQQERDQADQAWADWMTLATRGVPR